MTDEERRRRYEAYAIQQNRKPLRVDTTQPQRRVVVEPSQPQKYKVQVTPSVQIKKPKVSVVGKYLAPMPEKPKEDFGQFLTRVGTGIGLRGVRAGAGLVESAAGLYDLATPGMGTNRLSKKAGSWGKFIDETAKSEGTETAYKASAVPVEVLSTFVPIVGVAGKVGKGIEVGLKGTKLITKASKVAKTVEQASKPGKFAVKATKEFAKPSSLIADVGIASRYIGQEAAKGKEITPERIASEIALSVAGAGAVTGVGQLLGRSSLVKWAKETDVETIKQDLIKKFGDIFGQDLDETAEQIAKSGDANEVEQILDSALAAKAGGATESRPTSQTATDDIAAEITKTRNPEQIKEAVSALFPTMPEAELTSLSVRLARTTDINDVKVILSQAAARSEEVTRATQAAVPQGEAVDSATTQTEAVQEASPTVAPETPAIAETQASAPPVSVEGAIAPDYVPGTSQAVDTIQSVIEQNNVVRDANKENILKRVFGGVKRELLDPEYKLQNYDDTYFGVGQTPPNRSLTFLYRNIVASPQEAGRQMLKKTRTGESLADVMDRYISDQDGRPFVQYLNQKFALEIYEKSDQSPTMWKIKDFSPEQVARSVAEFEQANPQVIQDAQTVKAWADDLLDIGVAAGEIDQAYAEMIKQTYDNYVPLTKLFPEDRIAPRIVGGMGISAAKQNVVRYLTEGAADYDDTFSSLITRTNQVVKKANQNKLDAELFYRAKDGQDGLRVLIDPEVEGQRQQLLEEMSVLRDKLNEAKKSRGKLVADKRLAKAETTQAQTEAAEKARQYFVSQAVDQKGLGFANKLSKQELLDMFELLVETDEIKATRIAKKLAKKGDEYKRAIINAQQARQEVRDLRDSISGKYKETRGLKQYVEPGKEVAKGFVNGKPFAVQITDTELAKNFEYLNNLNNPDYWVSKGARISGAIAAPQKVAITGVLAPAFQAKQAVRQQFLKFTNVPGFSAFGARPMTVGWASGLARRGEVYDNLVEAGFTPPLATKIALERGADAKELASKANITSRLKYISKNPRQWWDSINKLAASLDVADRTQIGYAAYIRALNNNIPEAEAWQYGARAANEALGDLKRTSQLARNAEAIAPYSGATQAGYRALMRSFRERPLETSTKVASLMAPIVALTYYQADKYRDYYEDLISDNRTNDLDTNLVILNPLSTKNPDTGNWENVIKIPVAPDFKPLVRGSWKFAYDLALGKQPEAEDLLKEVANFLTANQAESLVGDPRYTSGVGRILPQSPLKQGTMIALGLKPSSGDPLSYGFDANKPRQEQYDDYTSEIAKRVSDTFAGALTPLQIDEYLNMFSMIGDVLQAAGTEGGIEKALKTPFKVAFSETKARTPSKKAGSAYYKDLEQVGKLFTEESQYKLWEGLREKRSGESGLLDSANKSLALLSNEEILGAEIEMNRRAVARGQASNPLYDSTLTPEQRAKVLMYRSMRAPNAAKQNYNKQGESAFVSLGLDEQWYQEFKKKEDAFWKSVIKEPSNKQIRTFSGAKEPKASSSLQKKLDYYYSLPKGTGDRSRFLAANKDVLAFWDKQNAFTNEEREALGFAPTKREDFKGSSKGYGFRAGGTRKPQVDVSTFISGIRPSSIDNTDIIDTAPRQLKFKVKLPSSGKGRSYKKIRLQ